MSQPQNSNAAPVPLEEIQKTWSDITLRVAQLETENSALEEENKKLRSLVERTQGVPRLLVELTRGLKRDGFVRKSERGSGHYLAVDELDKLPDLPIVQWNAIREVEALSPQLAGHARLASVLGNHFTVPELEALQSALEHDPLPDDAQLDAGVGVQRLVEGGLLLRHRAGRLSFRHALLRDTIYQLLPEPQRARLHRWEM